MNEYDPTDWRTALEKKDEQEQQQKDAKVKVPNTNMQAAGMAMQALKAGGNTAQKAGNMALSAGMATSNPYLMAAGAAAGVLGDKQQREDEYRQALYQAEQERKQRISNSLVNMANLYSGMRL